jgi:hypothetical protein
VAFAFGCDLEDLRARQGLGAGGGYDDQRIVGEALHLAAKRFAAFEGDSYFAADGEGFEVRPIRFLCGCYGRGKEERQQELMHERK